ncbi:MAG: ATP-grasp domain-containing protein [Alphaproteobacteria bacterium]
MLLYEHEGKSFLEEHGIPVPRAAFAGDSSAIEAASSALRFPVMVKAQALTGGRGKAGAILPAEDSAAARDAAKRLLGSTVKGEPVRGVLMEERASVARELYLAVTIEGGEILLLLGAEGGVEVESRGATLERLAIDPLDGLRADRLPAALGRLAIPGELWSGITGIATRLFALLRSLDATLAEINPLAVLEDGSLLALDARIEVDEGAFFRQPRLAAIKGARPAAEGFLGALQALEIQYAPMGGPIGLLSSGAGCGVTIMDWVAAEGSALSAFVDIDYALIAGKGDEAMRFLLAAYADDASIRAIIVNFTTCGLKLDEIALSLVAALDSLGTRLAKPVFIHLEGNRAARAHEIIRATRYPLSMSIGDAVRAACRAAKGEAP